MIKDLLNFKINNKIDKQILDKYKWSIHYAQEHIKDLEKKLKEKSNLIDYILESYIDHRVGEGEDERTATRSVYQDIYDEKWKNHMPAKENFMTREENNQWFDDNHDDWFCSGDHIANADYQDLMRWELGDIKKIKGGQNANR